jgi:4'-phosphopantetheinyl transferase
VARAALRIALGRCLDRPPDSLELVPDEQGKPVLAADDVGFNLAHSADLCVIAVSESGPIGVDVEEVRDFPELEGVVGARFAPAEAAGILGQAGDSRLRAFYRCWTRKEAYLKATGAGLQAGLDSVVVSVGDRPEILSATQSNDGAWSLADLDLDEGFIGAVAARGLQEDNPITVKPNLLSIDF